MKKSSYALLVCLVATCALCLVACHSNDTADVKVESESASEVATTDENYSPDDNEDYEDYGEDDIMDPLSIMEVESKTVAAEYGGFYLKRGDRFITLEASLKEPMEEVLGKGYWNTYAYWGSPDLILYDEVTSTCPGTIPSKDDLIMSYGDISVLALEPSDAVVAFSDKEIPTLKLTRIQFAGYSIGMSGNDYPGGSWTDGWIWSSSSPSEKTLITPDAKEEMQIVDSSGQPVEDRYNLEFGKEYTISWYQGTEYTEIQAIADCSYYKPLKEEFTIYRFEESIEGVATKEGYATYDLSNLEPGLYYSSRGGILRIK